MTIKDLERDLIAKGGNLSGIYKITRKSDGKIYIGQSECIVKRVLQHIDNKSETNSEKIDGAIKAEGWENFSYEIELALPQLNTEQLWLAESTYIARYDSYNSGFNKTKGNHSGKYDHDLCVRKNVVSAEITKFIRDHFKLEYANKKVLLINLFDEQFVNVLQYRGCEVIQISKYFEDKADLGVYIMEELKNYMGVKFDLIIANPPYGKIGANITKTIIDTIDYDEYVNLLPANDYIRNDSKDLYKYVDLDSMTAINKGFSDAAVTTHAAKITKKPHRYISWEEFQIENYIDPSLTKYFYETFNRNPFELDYTTNTPIVKIKTLDISKTVILGAKDVNHRHLPYSKNCVQYKWNVEESVNAAWVEANYACKSGGKTGQTSLFVIYLDSAEEKQALVNLLYGNTGFKFIQKLWTAINVDSYCMPNKYLPKIKLHAGITWEEILADYGYTQKEIDEVMADLANFKGMED